MYPIDYHVHTNRSPDSTADIMEICQSAVEFGIGEIAITNHFDPFANDLLCKNTYDITADFDDVAAAQERFSGRLTIRQGLEIGQGQLYPQSAREMINHGGFDYILGSVHNIADDIDLAEVDYFTDAIYGIIGQYFEGVLDVAKSGLYDCLGHIDYPRRYSLKYQANLDFSRYKDITAEILKTVIKQGKGIELNTSPLILFGVSSPDFDTIRLYRDLGGEIITVGSDCHLPEQVGRGFDLAYGCLKDVGFRYVCGFDKRNVNFISLQNIL